MINVDKAEKVSPEDYLREFWPPFVTKQYEEYEIQDIFIAFEALKVTAMKMGIFSDNADELIKDKQYMHGVLCGILIAMDELPLPVYITVEKTTKIRGIMRCYFDLLAEEIGTLLKA